MGSFKEFVLNEGEKNYVPGSPLCDIHGLPITMYHATGANFRKFNLKKTTQGIIWFTNNLKSLTDSQDKGGAQSTGRVITAHVNMENPAGWKEYDKLMLCQLKSYGFDGCILEKGEGSFDAFVFDPSQIQIIKNEKL